MNYLEQEHDELRAEFTVWLKKLVHNARVNYLKQNLPKIHTVSLSSLPEDAIIMDGPEFYVCLHSRHTFEFEEEKLARAFNELPTMKKRILTLLFVEEKSPREISVLLNCSVQHIYDERSRAIKRLRFNLRKEGETDVRE